MSKDNTDIDEQLARIRAKAAAQHVTFSYCLEPDAVARFEAQHGVVFPDGYRRFLLEVGNGGDMMNRLGNVCGDLDPDAYRSWAGLSDLAKPFPFTEAWVWEGRHMIQ